MTQLTELRLAGWKSIREAVVELRPLNVLIGANGAGKSNLVGFFKMMNEMRKPNGRFQVHIGTSGGAEALLFYGSKQTAAIEADFRFMIDAGQGAYFFRLVPALNSTLVFDEEKLTFFPAELPEGEIFAARERRGSRESELDDLYDLEEPNTDLDRCGKAISSYLCRCQVFHFHDTSSTSPMRRDCPLNSNRELSADGGNLPAMLYLYRERYPAAYRRIAAAVKAVAPYFDDFVLEPLRLNPRNIALHWQAKAPDPSFGLGTGSGIAADYEFGPHQLSDGTLRAIALFTLLLQPEEDLPRMIVLDEPELGLHPAALAVLADLVKAASQHTQLLIATQSTALIDHFEVEDVITVNLRDGGSTFDRLNADQLAQWLDEYALSELWERNVIGGGPY